MHVVEAQQTEAHHVKYLTLRAYQWGFDPPVLRVNRGDTVVIRVSSLDAVHGISIDGYDVSVKEVVPGNDMKIQLYAGTAGKFKIRCNSICGALHPFMVGELIVEPDIPFNYTSLVTLLVSIALIALFLAGVRDDG